MQKYRNIFRKKVIPKYYSARLHISVFIILELLALIIISQFIDWKIWSLVPITLTLIYATSFTYFLHRFALHQNIPGLLWAKKMHHWHHSFYPAHKMQYDHINDIYMLFMPPWIQLLYFFIYLPTLLFVLQFLFPLEVILHCFFALILWYGIYEFLHWSEHLPENHFLMKVPLLNRMRIHHTIHHSKKQHEINFGIVEPSWDYLLGTRL